LPLYIANQSQNTIRTEIQLPPKFRETDIAPRSECLGTLAAGGRARITSEASPGKRVITHEFETSPAIVNAKDYPALLQVEATLGKKSSRVFLLEKE
jgi:hypothetical protein